MFQIYVILLVTITLAEGQNKNTVTIAGDRGSIIITADPLERLKFLQQPEDKEVDEYGSVVMYCKVDTVDNVDYEYVWYRITDFSRGMVMTDDTRIAGADEDVLRIAEVQPLHDGQYICTVSILGTNHTIVSNSGKLTVNYFTEEAKQQRTITAQVNQNYVQLECDVPSSFPEVQVTWYKLQDRVSDNPRMFILPENSRFFPNLKRGSLIIMYIEQEDQGRYFCKTTHNDVEYTLTQYYFDVDGEVQTSPYINAYFISTVHASSKLGGRAEFFCAGIGKPSPLISWQKEDGSRIETSEHYMLEDNKRRLVITNVNEDDDDYEYTCTLSVDTLPERKQILYLTILASANEMTFVTAPVSHIIYTNRYPPFTLRCAIDYAAFIDIDGNLKPVLYWLKDGKQLEISKRMSSITEENSSSKTLQNTIEFISTNEDDLGLYQCIAQSDQQIRQTAAHVNVRRMSRDYDVTTVKQKYDVVNTPMAVDAAEEYCRSWSSNGHLVSIMSRQEAQDVVLLLERQGIQQAWIGLTSEDVRSPGHWKWTQPADNSQTFSYWSKGMPDNLYGREHYAIMDTTLDGRWLDVKNKSPHPFVCKQYSVSCPSVYKMYEGKVEVLNRVENSQTRYGVGDTITVTCSDKKVALKEVLTCTTRERFEPDGIVCPLIDNKSSRTVVSSLLLVLSLILAS